jgi:hypothetical protein
MHRLGLARRRARPAGAGAAVSCRKFNGIGAPLVVFSHGLGGSRSGYTATSDNSGHRTESRHCIRSTLGSDRAVWTEQRAGRCWASLRAAASTDNAIARVRDVSYASSTVRC